MQFNSEQIEELAKATCPLCKAGVALRYRDDTKEFVHDSGYVGGKIVEGHSICWANGLRKEYGNG